MSKETKTQKEIIEKMVTLIRENPDLPVVPIVDAEVVGDDYGIYGGEFGDCLVDEHLISKYNQNMYFKSDNDVYNTLENCLSAKEWEELLDEEKGISECMPYYQALPWKKAIIIYVTQMSD